jgi:hypothetical protein
MPKRKRRTIESVKRKKHYTRLEACVHARVDTKTTIDMAAAHALADMRHICDGIGVDYDIADRIGGIYYAAEVGGSLR